MVNAIPLDRNALADLLGNPLMVRLVTVVNVTSQSILEILEYGFTPSDVSRALVKGVVEFDKLVGQNSAGKTDVIKPGLEMGDYYFELLNRKIRLAKLGLLMLEILEADLKQASRTQAELAVPAHEQDSLFNQRAIHVQ